MLKRGVRCSLYSQIKQQIIEIAKDRYSEGQRGRYSERQRKGENEGRRENEGGGKRIAHDLIFHTKPAQNWSRESSSQAGPMFPPRVHQKTDYCCSSSIQLTHRRHSWCR